MRNVAHASNGARCACEIGAHALTEQTHGGSVRANVDVVEYLGNEELLHVVIAGADVVAVVSADRRVRPDDDVTVHIPLDKVHLFDAESELSLPRIAVG